MNARHVARHGGGPARRRDRGADRGRSTRALTLTRLLLRHARPTGPLVILAVLTILTTTALVASPRLGHAAYDRAAGEQLGAAPLGLRDIVLRHHDPTSWYQGDLTYRSQPVSPVATIDRTVRSVLGPSVSGLVTRMVFTATSDPHTVTRPARSLGPSDRQATAQVVSGFEEKVTWVRGDPPGKGTKMWNRPATALGAEPAQRPVVPMAVAESTAASWGLEIGDVLEFVKPGSGRAWPPNAAWRAEVVGTFAPTDRNDSFWQLDGTWLATASIPTPDGGSVEQASLITSPENYVTLAAAMYALDGAEFPDSPSPDLVHVWRYQLDFDALTRADLAEVSRAVARLTTSTEFTDVRPKVLTGLPDLIEDYEHDIATTTVTLSFLTVGLTLLALLALSLTSALIVHRRRDELRLLRSRGASLPQTGFLTGGAIGLWALVPAALAAAAVHWLLPGAGGSHGWVEVAIAVVGTMVVAVGVAVRAVRLGSAPQTAAATARRVLVDIVVVALAGFVVNTLRSRGSDLATGTVDWYAAAAPVLVALAAAVFAVRVLPALLTGLAALARRGRGWLGYLALARATRDHRVVVVPVAALVVATTLVTVATTLATSIDTQRDLAAYQVVGADARVDAIRLDPADLAELADRPGVTEVVPAHVAGEVTLSAKRSSGAVAVTLVGLDPAAYARVVAGTPLAFTAPNLPSSAPPMPVLVSEASGATDGDFDIVLRGLRIPSVRAGVIPSLARVRAGRLTQVAVVPADLLRDRLAGAVPNTAYLRVDDAGAAELAEAGSDIASLATGVTTRRHTAAAVADRSLPTLVRDQVVATGVLATLFALIGVLTLLAATRSARTDLLVRLRTLGARRGRWWLGAIEVLPLLAAAVATGVLVGVAVPGLLGRVLDLAPWTGGAPFPPVRASWPWLVAIAVTMTVTGAVALAVDSAAARHTDLAQELRRGDRT